MATRSPRQHIAQVVHEDLTLHTRRELVRAVIRGHSSGAAMTAREFDEPEAHDVESTCRRGKIERELRAVAERIGDVRVEVHSTRDGRSNFTVAQVGRLVITQAAVNDQGGVPRWAEYRNIFAANPQIDLFRREQPNLNVPTDQLVYAILIHGPRIGRARLPDFVALGVPDSECREYEFRLPLSDLIADLVLEEEQVTVAPRSPPDGGGPSPTIPTPEPDVKLRRKRRRTQSEGG